MRALVSAIALLVAEGGVFGLSALTTVRDLGYAVYRGTHDGDNGIDVFKGIRYAAPPLGNLRFAAPRHPRTNRTIQQALDWPPQCPQTGASVETPAEYGFTSAPGNEDCLFLNVWTPSDATNLPVIVWIHGGGYGLFSSTGLDPTELMVTNDNRFISVIIQYRLGAFGFLSSDDVKRSGALNAGLLDMNFALQWVQRYISKFGGDPGRVTIAGESAGSTGDIYQALAYGKGRKSSLFNNIISASPWVPYQHYYNDATPTKAYNDFVSAAGCSAAHHKVRCLRQADTAVLQNASQTVSEAGSFGTFAFLPVTDDCFVKDTISAQLSSKSLSGFRVLSGNMANEGVPLARSTTKTLAEFRNYIKVTFPEFDSVDKARLESIYSYADDTLDVDLSAPLFDTDGTSGATAVNQSAFATGQAQRAINVFAEYAFQCPSYWLASAAPKAWKYQFSAPPSYHGFDLQALWSGTKLPGRSLKHTFRKIWGNFIVNDSPLISIADIRAGSGNATVSEGDGWIEWPEWDSNAPVLLSLNTTGGSKVFINVTEHLKYYVYPDPGVTNELKLADAYAWEGGRGKRCDWWLAQASKVPY